MQSTCGAWISDWLSGDTMEGKQKGLAALACIASSARDVALHIAQQDDVLDEVLVLVDVLDVVDVLVVVDVLLVVDVLDEVLVLVVVLDVVVVLVVVDVRRSMVVGRRSSVVADGR